MAEKISTLIIKVDLECSKCYRTIRKTLCKLQEKENIRTISYDEKNNTVTVSGPFDPKKLSKKLYCKACKVIKDIQIVEPKEKEKAKEQEKPMEKPKEVKVVEQPKEKEKPKEVKVVEPPKEKEKPKEKLKEVKVVEPPKEKEKEKPKDKPKEVKVVEPPKEKEKPKELKVVESFGNVPQMPPPAYPQCWPVAPVCNCGPWYEAHYGGTRCCACGRSYGWVSDGPIIDGNRTCHFFSDEDPNSSCTIM